MYCQLVTSKIKKEIKNNIKGVVSNYQYDYVVNTYTDLFADTTPLTAPLCVNETIVTDYIKGVLDSFEVEKTSEIIERYVHYFQDVSNAIDGQLVGDVVKNIDSNSINWLKPPISIDRL
jgi:hypothetical protein